jgi:hypothetical protein
MRPTTTSTADPTPHRTAGSIARAVLATLALALAATACAVAGERSSDDTAATATATEPAPAPAPESSGSTEAPDPPAAPAALVARPTADTALYEQPGDVEPTRELPARTDFGTPLALLVTEVGAGAAEGWVRVLVPGRPNGAEAWLPAAGLELREVRHEVHVDLGTRTLEVLEDGEVVLETPVAVGDPAHPTPAGRFSITDKLDTGDPAGPYGPYALGLSARSEVLTEFAGGDGQVGIHGTDDPTSIGEAVSAGCIRVPNETVEVLADLLPLGTPVTVS